MGKKEKDNRGFPVVNCEHLVLVPEDHYKGIVAALLWEITEAEDNTPEEIEDYKKDLCGPLVPLEDRHFAGYCKHKKDKGLCHAIAVACSNPGPLSHFLNAQALRRQCNDFDSGEKFLLPLADFLISHISMEKPK